MTPEAIILIDHGSPRQAVNDQLTHLATMLAGRTGVPVYPAHMEVAEPTFARAFDEAIAGGARHIVVAPYFLGAGRHGAGSIPALAAEAAEAHPEVSVAVAEPLGIDPALADVLVKRVRPHLTSRGTA